MPWRGGWRPPSTRLKSKKPWDLRYVNYQDDKFYFKRRTERVSDHCSSLQACSAKSLERLRSQQESLRSLQPQVLYLRDLAQGLVQDAPQTPEGAAEGAQSLQQHARETEREYEDVSKKVSRKTAGFYKSHQKTHKNQRRGF